MHVHDLFGESLYSQPRVLVLPWCRAGGEAIRRRKYIDKGGRGEGTNHLIQTLGSSSQIIQCR